jgi:hypothetical protein
MALENPVMNLRVPEDDGKFLSSWTTVSFSTTELRGDSWSVRLLSHPRWCYHLLFKINATYPRLRKGMFSWRSICIVIPMLYMKLWFYGLYFLGRKISILFATFFKLVSYLVNSSVLKMEAKYPTKR